MQLRAENAALGGTIHAVLEARAETLRGSSVETHRPSAPRCGWACGARHAPCAHRGLRRYGRRARGARRGPPAAHTRAEQNGAAGALIPLRPGSYLLPLHAARTPHCTPCTRSIAQTPRSHPQPPHSDPAHKPPLRAGVLEAERSGDNKRKCPQGMQEAVRVNIIALAVDHFEPRRGSHMGRFSSPAYTRQQHRVLGARNYVVVLANCRVIGIGANAAPHRMGRRCGTDPAKTHGGRPASTERGATQPGAALQRACCVQAGGCCQGVTH